MITSGRLAEIWPEVERRLLRRLAATGVDRDTAEDIAQEVALRALDRKVPCADADDFCRWAFTVARNLHIDDTRLRARVTTVVDVPDQPDGRDVAVEVEQRLLLRRTFSAMASMRATDRDAIVDGVNASAEPARAAAVRQAVRRHRARARLLRMVEGLAALWPLLRRGWRRTAVLPAAATVSAVALVLPAQVLPHDPDGAPGAPAGRGPAVSVDDAALVTRLLRERHAASGAGGPGGAAAPPAAAIVPDDGDSEPAVEVDALGNGGSAGSRRPKPEDCTISTGNLPEPVPRCVKKPRPGDVPPVPEVVPDRNGGAD